MSLLPGANQDNFMRTFPLPSCAIFKRCAAYGVFVPILLYSQTNNKILRVISWHPDALSGAYYRTEMVKEYSLGSCLPES